MAFTTLLTVVMLASVVNAGSSSWSDDGNLFNSKVFRYVNPLPLPSLPKLPGFPNLSLPPLLWPGGSDNFPKFDQFPTNFQQIVTHGGGPGSEFSGGAVVSHSSSVRGPDGKIQRQSGSTFLVNNNGEVIMHKTGNAPPDVQYYTNRPVSGN